MYKTEYLLPSTVCQQPPWCTLANPSDTISGLSSSSIVVLSSTQSSSSTARLYLWSRPFILDSHPQLYPQLSTRESSLSPPPLFLLSVFLDRRYAACVCVCVCDVGVCVSLLEGQEEHEHYVDDDEQHHDHEDHHILSLAVEVAA